MTTAHDHPSDAGRRDWPQPGPARRRYATEHCFVCGRANPAGCRAAFVTDGQMAWAETVPGPHLQGFAHLVHGGVVGALLDEAMWYALYVQGAWTVTVHLEVTLRRPVPPGEPLRVEAVATGRDRRYLLAQARLWGPDGQLCAEATGRFLAAPEVVRHQAQTLLVEELDGAGGP